MLISNCNVLMSSGLNPQHINYVCVKNMYGGNCLEQGRPDAYFFLSVQVIQCDFIAYCFHTPLIYDHVNRTNLFTKEYRTHLKDSRRKRPMDKKLNYSCSTFMYKSI